ncbi:hypothetical protein, partial [Streptacidiphilus neutrinimicus]|uniref:hypothetical protein n=1 Tax=Streptacidiphilus neutrinimicus TaxID=105420 RepID=UPI0005A79ADF
MTSTTREAVARTWASLNRYTRALRPGPESDAAIDAAWQLHRDVAQLLPAVQTLLDERDDLAAR